MLLIDYKKAFDSIDHNYIYATLKLLNFGEDLISWVKLFLTERIAHILLGGHLTLKILLEQGVPQGDIISPFASSRAGRNSGNAIPSSSVLRPPPDPFAQ